MPGTTTTTPDLPDGEDTDDDGLLDSVEEELGTDPLNPDTDGDGLPDGVEVFETGTDPLNPDTNGDGILDGREAPSSTTTPVSPTSIPSEDIVVPLVTEDADQDGLTFETELALGTDPDNADTDGDGINDGQEVADGTDPLDASDPGKSFLTDPGTLAAAAGVAAAVGLGLSGLGSKLLGGLLRFLGGTGFGLFLIGLFRRDKRPGPPIDFTIFTDGPLTHLAWSSPTTGGPAEKYVLEGRKDGRWGELLDFDAEHTRAAVPTSEIEGTEAWRLRAANDHGMGKPSDEVGAVEAEVDPDLAEGEVVEESDSGIDGA